MMNVNEQHRPGQSLDLLEKFKEDWFEPPVLREHVPPSLLSRSILSSDVRWVPKTFLGHGICMICTCELGAEWAVHHHPS